MFVLPNLFTVSSIFCGFYALTLCLSAQPEPIHLYRAAVAIFFGMFFDMFDGRVARLTRTQSEFGVQLDSLADVISFGMAPALMIYLWALAALPKPWSLAPFLYLAAGATRLARFNIQVPSQDRRFFVGLPIPAAACVLAATVFYSPARVVDPIAAILVAVLLSVLGLLMVSQLRYRSFKEIDVRGRVPWAMVAAMALVFFVVAASPQLIGLALSFAYLLSGLFPRRVPPARPDPRPATAGGPHAGH